MKKFYSLFAVAMLTISIANSQCIVDPNAQTVPGVTPTADQLPCIVAGVPYNQTLQGKIQESDDISILILTLHVQVDSVQVDSIGGLPNGITYSRNPDVLLGGGNGCIQFTGTTLDSAGSYPLTAFGTAWLQITQPFPFPRVVNGNLNRFSPFGNYALTVIKPGDPCVPSVGIKDFNAALNTAFSVYPNPSNGLVNVNLNAGKRMTGEMAVVDMTGRTVFTQPLDLLGLYNTTIDLSRFAKGVYTVQLKTTEGFAAKNISIE